MGRGRVHLKRIEDKISRQVTFSKRRTGLLKKAREISVLCDAQVALIVFSANGKLFDYSAQSSMEIVLERYERNSDSERELSQADVRPQGNWFQDFPKLTARMEVLQRNLRKYLGEELEATSLRELQHLEQQLEAALKRIRIRQNKLMHESIVELQKKAKALQEQNNSLRKKHKKENPTAEHTDEEQENILALHSLVFNSSEPQQLAVPIRHDFQDREAVDDDEVAETQMQSRTRNSMPPWLLHHMNR